MPSRSTLHPAMDFICTRRSLTHVIRSEFSRCKPKFRSVQSQPFSVLNRPTPNYAGHVPLTKIERTALAVGSAVGSLINPHRHDLVATLAETTSNPYFLPRLHAAMLRSPTGRRILRDRPRITSKTLSLSHLRSLPPNTVGRAYAAWLDREGVTPDTRDTVRYVDDAEQAYVMQRYRECHDFYHAVTGLPVFVEGELALKAFEAANMALPMPVLALAAVVKLKREAARRFFGLETKVESHDGEDEWEGYLVWALRNGLRAEDVINVYWEVELDTDVDELRDRLGIEAPPDLRKARRTARDRRKAEMAAQEAGQTLGGFTKH